MAKIFFSDIQSITLNYHTPSHTYTQIFASSLVSQSEQCRLVELIFEMRLSLSPRCWVPQVPQHSNLIAVGARKLKLCGRTPPFPPSLLPASFGSLYHHCQCTQPTRPNSKLRSNQLPSLKSAGKGLPRNVILEFFSVGHLSNVVDEEVL